jgi:hypothetical protein
MILPRSGGSAGPPANAAESLAGDDGGPPRDPGRAVRESGDPWWNGQRATEMPSFEARGSTSASELSSANGSPVRGAL